VALDQFPEGVGVATEAGRDKLLIALGRRESLDWTHDKVANILSSCQTQIKGLP
jgi:hypothetical protein